MIRASLLFAVVAFSNHSLAGSGEATPLFECTSKGFHWLSAHKNDLLEHCSSNVIKSVGKARLALMYDQKGK